MVSLRNFTNRVFIFYIKDADWSSPRPSSLLTLVQLPPRTSKRVVVRTFPRLVASFPAD